MLVEHWFVKNQTVLVISPAHPRGVGFNDVTPIGRPILGVVRPSSNHTKKFPEHFCTGRGTLPTWSHIISHDKISTNAPNKIFPYFCKVVGCDVMILRGSHRFSLQTHLSFVRPADLCIKSIRSASCMQACLMRAEGEWNVILEAGFKFLDNRHWKVACSIGDRLGEVFRRERRVGRHSRLGG